MCRGSAICRTASIRHRAFVSTTCEPTRFPLGLTTPSARAKSLAGPNRSAGVFSSAVSTAASTFAGIERRVSVSGVGSEVRIRPTIVCAVAPWNGGSPVSIS